MNLLRWLLLATLCFGTVACSQDALPEPLNAQLSDLLPNDEAGVAVGLIEEGDETVSFVGNPDFTEETLFEYGSITKVFTAVLLTQLTQEGVVQLDESINAHLPADVQDGKWDTVTFQQLATHSAGLPPLPPNMDEAYFEQNLENPYANYDRAMLYEAVAEVELEPAGEFNTYSNFGFGLLGTLLAEAAGTPYADLVEARAFTPLEMDSATVNGWSSENRAPPLSADGSEVSAWDFDAMAGAGAVRGSLGDALKFLQASITACAEETPLAVANCQAQQATEVKTSENEFQGLGWARLQSEAGDIVWHNGGTGGFSTFLGFNVEKEVGIVLLANFADDDLNVTLTGLEFLATLE